jgi:hypothetical protein
VDNGLTSGVSNEASATPQSPLAQIPYAATTPVIDGNADPVWDSAPSYAITRVVAGYTSQSGAWQAMWDSSNLYVLITVNDPSPIDGTIDYNGDATEVYIDATDSKGASYGANDFQYVLGWEHAQIDEYAHGAVTGVQYAQTTTSGGYCMEFAFPWSTLGITPVASDFIGFDAGIDAALNTTTRAGQLMWYGTAQDFQNPSLFGTGLLLPDTTPTISSFNPNTGGIGSDVTVTGTNFTGATAVTFGGIPAITYTVTSNTSITATVPAGAITGPIGVTTPAGTATSSGSFTVTFTLTPQATTNGALSPNTAQTVDYGSSQQFTAAAAPWYTFTAFTVDGSPLSSPATLSDGTTVTASGATLTFGNVQGSHTLSAAFTESAYGGDVLGHGTVDLSDWVEIGRIAVGLDSQPAGIAYQCADCAPRSTRGSGLPIDLADWVQTGRYVVGLDPLTPAGGPSAPSD